MAWIFIHDEKAIRPDSDVGMGPHRPPVAYGLGIHCGILMAVGGERSLAIKWECLEPQFGIAKCCFEVRTSPLCI
jgi:hypothetical protein